MCMTVGAAAVLWLSVRWRGVLYMYAGSRGLQARLTDRVVQQPSKIPHAREQCAGMARENRG